MLQSHIKDQLQAMVQRGRDIGIQTKAHKHIMIEFLCLTRHLTPHCKKTLPFIICFIYIHYLMRVMMVKQVRTVDVDVGLI